MSSFAQEPVPSGRCLLFIPGPIEVSPSVKAAYSQHPLNHFAEPFISIFSETLKMMRHVWKADENVQPFIVAGSGTLGMEMAVWNLLEAGDRCLVCVTGYFGDRFVEMVKRRGCDTDVITAEVGHVVTEPEIRAHLSKAAAEGKPVKVIFCTHVDTSTGVRMDVEMVCRLAREFGALSVHDGVCATAAERFEFSQWGADIYLTGSQKAVGVPCGLTLLGVSQRALAARKALKQLPPYYMDFERWLPIMRGYEEKAALYFATPATTLIPAVHASFKEILNPTVDANFAAHERAAAAMHAAFKALGLKFVAVDEQITPHSMSNLWAPAGVDVTVFLAKARERGLLFAGALHPQLKGKTFRIGHMGYAAHQDAWLLRAVEVLEEALVEAGAQGIVKGSAVQAAQRVLSA